MAENGWEEKNWAWVAVQLFLPSPFRQIGVPVVVGGLAALVFDFGGDVPGSFYGAAAQIAPVVALAAVVEQAVALRSEVCTYEHQSPGDRMDTRWAIHSLVNVQLGLLVVTEAGALSALASRSSNTFLLMTVVAGLATQTWWLAWAARERYGFEPPEAWPPREK